MTINKFGILCWVLAIMNSCVVFSQTPTTTVINYETWSGSGCNVFASSTGVPAIVNGSTNITIAHRTNIGQPQYDNTNKAISLTCTYDFGTKGTEYNLAYNFQTGYKYSITINAAKISATSSGPNPNLRILPNVYSGSSSLCNGNASIDAATSGGLYRNNTINSGTWVDYSYNYNPIASANSLLNISAVPSSNSTFHTVLIRKITIVETPTTTPPVNNCLSEVIFNSGVIPAGKQKGLNITAGSSAGTGGSGTVTVNSTDATSLIALDNVTLKNEFSASVSAGGNFSIRTVATCPDLQAARVAESVPILVKMDEPVIYKGEVNIYPVPSTGLITIITKDRSAITKSAITVYDKSGKVVYRSDNQVKNTRTQLDLSHLSNDIYFIKVNTNNKVVTGKIIINK